jgi:hypothetical protein
MKHIKHASETLAATPYILLKHPDETLATYVHNIRKHAHETLAKKHFICVKTHATSRSKYLQHTSRNR